MGRRLCATGLCVERASRARPAHVLTLGVSGVSFPGPDPGPWPAVHLIGVGGHSMSGLALAMARLGIPVSGSDLVTSARTARVAASGATVTIGHDAGGIARLPPGTLIVFNTDVPADNAELVAARARGLHVAHRSEVLDWFLRGGHLTMDASPAVGSPAAGGAPSAYDPWPTAPCRTGRFVSVAITGTHGKTTTTALTGLALLAGGCDPTIFVGADVPYLAGGNQRLGAGRVVVAEVDESDGSFVRYRPDVVVLTNLEPEHLEHYGGDFANVRATMSRFLENLAHDALVIACADDPVLRDLIPAQVAVLWYGLGPRAELVATDMCLGAQSTFTPVLRGRPLDSLALGIPGRHNVSDALAAVAVAHHLGVPPVAFASAFADFHGAERRFQVLTHARGVIVVDDYAHNPTKVAAALAGARLLQPRRLVAIFQPHRYQRTQQLWEGFAAAFRDADLVLLDDLYAPAGESPLPGVGSAGLARAIAARSGVAVRHIVGREALVAAALADARPGDLFLVMGAGDITLVARALADRLQATEVSAATP